MGDTLKNFKMRAIIAIGLSGALGVSACGSGSSTGAATTAAPTAATTATSSAATTAAAAVDTTAAAATSAPVASGGTDTTAAATPVSIVAPTGDPFVMSVLTPDTGAGNLKAEGDGFEAFVAYANAEDGGFGGSPGEVKRCDYANDPQKATDCARAASDDASVMVAMGAGRYGDSLVTTLGAASDPVGYVCPGLTRPAEGAATNSFCLYAGSPMGSYSMMTYAQSKGLKKGYLTTADSDAGHATAESAKVLGATLGLTIDAGFFPAAQSDFLPVAQAAMSSGADFLIIGAGVPQELAMAQAFVTLGNTLPIGTWSALLPQSSLDQLTGATFPIISDAVVPDASTSADPEIVLYRTWMQKQGYGDELGDISLIAWLSGRTIQDAANQLATAGTAPSRSAVLDILRNGNLDVPILPSPLSLKNAPKTAGFASVANPTVNISVFEHGTKTVTDQQATLP